MGTSICGLRELSVLHCQLGFHGCSHPLISLRTDIDRWGMLDFFPYHPQSRLLLFYIGAGHTITSSQYLPLPANILKMTAFSSAVVCVCMCVCARVHAAGTFLLSTVTF